MDRHLIYFNNPKICYVENTEYSLFDRYKMFPMKKYYYIILHYKVPDNVISYGKINREMFVHVKCSEKFLTKEKDILKFKNVYSTRFLSSQIELVEESEKFRGFIFSSGNNDRFLFTESNTFGGILNYFFGSKKYTRNEVKLTIEVFPFKISSIIIKSTDSETPNDLTTIIEYNAFRETQENTGDINFTGLKYTI